MGKRLKLQDIEHIVRDIVIPFYGIERDMVIPDKSRRNESDAKHSWSLAFVACSLAPQIDPELNVGLVAQFALVHDLPELYAGDVSVFDHADKLASKHKNETAAIKRISQEYEHLPWISETLEAYERRNTNEAKFVYALDKLLPLLIRKIDNGRAYVDIQLTREQFLAGLSSSREKAQTHEVVGEYYEELWAIFKSRPDYFYQPNGRLR
jgi:5'-deoxynucleotidase YfbR-like HD superfamily hydrolase